MKTYIVTAVAVWWIANIIASLSSKSVMEDNNVTAKSSKSWTPAFEDWRWIELTFIQHLIGGIASIIWLKVVSRKPAWTQHSLNTHVQIASLANVVGNTATNAAYAAVSSCMTQVVKACEPLVTLALAVFLLKKYENVSVNKALSILVMVVGASTLVMVDNTSNIVGLIAAVGSTVCFPLRNVYLKRLEEEHPLQQYAVISLLGVGFLLPLLALKYAVTKTLFVLRWKEGALSAVCHFVYNVASITVLQSISPVSHSILNLLKRVAVVLTNIAYFRSPPISWDVTLSLLVFFLGLAFHSIASNSRNVRHSLKVHLSIGLGTLCMLLAFFFAKHQLASIDSPGTLTITTSWVFEEPVPPNVIQNVHELAYQNPMVPVHVYCGTSQCVRSLKEISAENIEVKFLVISDIVKGMPIEKWLVRHPLNKVLAGVEFENHLHEAVRLGLIWNYGGLYVDPMVKIGDNFNLLQQQKDFLLEAWVSNGTSPENDLPHILDAAFFPEEHSFIGQLAELFTEEYPTIVTKDKPFKFNFREIVWEAYKSLSLNQSIYQAHLKLEKTNSGIASRSLHFGTLSFDYRVQKVKAANLGDEIQGFPGLQFLPYIDFFVERDKLEYSTGKQNITTFFNAWWGDPGSSWPPPNNIDPIMTSVHVDAAMQNLWKRGLGFLQNHEPIGCRDYTTLKFMQNLGIRSYFSACLTLLIRNPVVAPQPTKIYLVDVSKKYVNLLPQRVKDNAIIIQHVLPRSESHQDRMIRFTKAFNLLEMYGEAKVVITQRIHAALPCVGMGIPVIFFNSPGLPGGGGTRNVSSSRIAGLTPLFHTLEMYEMSEGMAIEWLQNFPWDNIPPNPNVHMAMRHRATTWNVIRQNRALYDAARKFGLIPIPHLSSEPGLRLLFHIALTVPVETYDEVQTSLSWKQWRCIESILHHHPFAKVSIHSNSILQSEFDVLTEAGYSVDVHTYNLEKMLEGSPAHDFREQLENAMKSELWYSHETELLQALILYKQGGIFVDTDMIIVRPLDSLETNVLAWGNPEKMIVNGAFMIFEKSHPYLEDYLKNYGKHYNHHERQAVGDRLLTQLLGQSSNTNDVHVMDYSAFYIFYNMAVDERCFQDTSGEPFSSNMKILKEEAYAVQVSSEMIGKKVTKKIKSGTICSYLFNSFCVLCNEIY